MKFALRDDDTSYFTAPDALARVYADIWDRVPVCLAVVPFAIGYEQPGIPREHWRSGESFGLERNQGLVARLRELVSQRRATVALHGYTHQDFPDGFEFEAAPDLAGRVCHGRAYLEQQIGSAITVFVPPHNALSKRGLAAVSAAGLNLLGSFLSFRPSMRPWDRRTLANYWRVRRVRAAMGRRRRDRFVYPYVLRYQHHAEFGCHSLVPGTTADELIRSFDEARAVGGDFCVAAHYWEVDDEMRRVLERVIAHAARFPDVRFTTVEELFA
jgi:predicted deacetylase